MALKLGASEVVGTDLDPDCMTSTHENFEVNHLDSRLGTFYVGNLIDDVSFQPAYPLTYDGNGNTDGNTPQRE